WLTTVVSRLCLDRMRSAAARREHYAGPWLPEPVVRAENDPGAIVSEHDEIRLAALRVLHELTAEQRLALVLHEGFEVPFAEIAALLGCPPAAARQHASRGRRALARADPPPPVPLSEQRAVLQRFLDALATRDVPTIARTLHPNVVVHGDGGGKARTARRPVVGADKVARFAVGLMTKYDAALFEGAVPVLVNGAAGLWIPGASRVEIAARVLGMATRDGLVAELHDIVNPDKLTRVPQ